MIVFQRIGVVVVTRNRRALLARCLEAIRGQTRPPDRVLVVDNAGTDGTAAMVRARFPEVALRVLAENTGGGGGFHAGLRHLLDEDLDGFWLMDDDAVPAPTCLEHLLGDAPERLVRAPLVVSTEDPERLAFGYRWDGAWLHRRAEAEAAARAGVLVGVANPFNGLLVHRRAVEAVGLPMPELFIWGDEREYLYRLRAGGFEVATVVAAVLAHPPNRMPVWTSRLAGRRFRLPYADDPLRQYLFTRNDAYIARRYRGWRGVLGHLARHVWFTLTRRGPRATVQALRASWDGLQGRLDRHRRWLDDHPAG